MPIDPDKLARQLARQKKQREEEGKRQEEADKHATQERLRAEIRSLTTETLSLLEAHGYPGLTDVHLNTGRSALTYKPRKPKPVAGWEIGLIEYPKFDGFARHSIWLLANGDFATTNAGTKFGGNRHTLDDLFLAGFLPEIRGGLRELVTKLRAS